MRTLLFMSWTGCSGRKDQLANRFEREADPLSGVLNLELNVGRLPEDLDFICASIDFWSGRTFLPSLDVPDISGSDECRCADSSSSTACSWPADGDGEGEGDKEGHEDVENGEVDDGEDEEDGGEEDTKEE